MTGPNFGLRKVMQQLGITALLGEYQRAGNLLDFIRHYVGVHDNNPDSHGLGFINDLIATNTANISTLLTRPQRSFTRAGYDDFNRSAGAMGSAVLGGTWSGFGSGLAVIDSGGTTAISAATGTVGAIYGGLLSTRTSDQRLSLTLKAQGKTGHVGALLRYQDGNNYVMVLRDAAAVYIYDTIGGTQTLRATYVSAPVLATETLVAEIVGSVITVLLNGTVVATYSTALAGGTGAGFRLSGTSALDDIEIASEAGGLLRQVQLDLSVTSGIVFTVMSRDTFTATDGTALAGHTTDLGGYAWSALFASGATITSNAVSTPSSSTFNLLAATSADAAVTQEMTLGTGDAWIYFRFNGGTNTGLLFQRTNTGQVNVLRQVNGATTAIYSVGVANTGGLERMTVIGYGQTLAVYVNGVIVLTFVDATSQTIATHGIRRSANASVDNHRVARAEGF